MRSIIIIFLLSGLCYFANAQDIKSICTQINELNNDVRDNQIDKSLAKNQFRSLLTSLNKLISLNTEDKTWIFPLQGYKSNAIGGTKGNGYTDKGYNYFDGNKHAAHPAHDIFINDRNQDLLDDTSHKPVNVLAIADGIVLACCDSWETNSALRGGKYIWIYHPQLNILSYYAHNNIIFVAPGSEVKQGERIAEVGRSGYNAYKRRSPTHLHFSAFLLKDNLPVPFNCYHQLVNAGRK